MTGQWRDERVALFPNPVSERQVDELQTQIASIDLELLSLKGTG